MGRQLYVFRQREDGTWKSIPIEEAQPSQTSHQSHYIIGDTMEPTLNMVDGKVYDSKSAYMRTVRAAGCDVIGNEAPEKVFFKKRETNLPHLKEDLIRAYDQLASRGRK